jgi:hypothetical protein
MGLLNKEDWEHFIKPVVLVSLSISIGWAVGTLFGKLGLWLDSLVF